MKRRTRRLTGGPVKAGRVNPLALRAILALLCLTLLGAGINLWSNRMLSAGAATSTQAGQQSPDGLWQESGEMAAAQSEAAEQSLRPPSERLLKLNQEVLTRLLRQAPMELSAEAQSAPLILTIPLPDRTFARFSVVESPMMAPELAAKFPEIKTYCGQGIDDPTATLRFDWMPTGFHAMVLSTGDTVYVDPYAQGDPDSYISYYKHDYQKDGAALRSLVIGATETGAARPKAEATEAPLPGTEATRLVGPHGTERRVYRLALAATVEYTQAAGGTKAGAMMRMTTSMNRVNGIFEREIAVRLEMIANNDAIIYTAEPDPYENTSDGAELDRNQKNLDTVIGDASYDIGHLFSTASGGVAGSGVVCRTGEKARGQTGSANPVGDSFDVDLASQELAHQFGTGHTFNGVTDGCAGSNRSPDSAYEPGSGSTIGGYANLCGAQNLQLATDDYFHVKDLELMTAYIAGAGNCATRTPTGNTPPTVSAGPNFTIPKGTPFTLTATGSDPNGDVLTYCWEEYDLGPQSPPDNDSDGMARPIFRSYRPTTSPARTFPRMDYILANPSQPPATYNCGQNQTCITGESLPSIARTMNFQVTARDNRAGGGGVTSAQMALTVDGNSGPFLVTAPAAGAAWQPGSTQTVTWNVANTSAAPVNAASVKISLSTDGGNTFPVVLAESVPNNGTATITVPNNPAPNSRIKVEAVGNIFFSVSPNLAIRPPCAAITVTPVTLPDAPLQMDYNQTVTATGGTAPLNFSVSAGALPNGVTLSAAGQLAGPPQEAGTYNFTVTATDAQGCTGNQAYTLKVIPAANVGDTGANVGATGGGGNSAGALATTKAGRKAGKASQAASLIPVTFPVTLTAASNETVTIHFETVDGTAEAGVNYHPVAGTLTFQPGETTKNVTVMVMGVSSGEPSEEFTVLLTDPVNAFIEDGTGECDLIEDDISDCEPFTLNPPTLPAGKVGVSYNQLLTGSGNTAGLIEFALTGGTLPRGLTLNETNGQLSGIPLTPGTFTFELSALDASFCDGSREYTLTIAPAAPAILSFSPESGQVGNAVTIIGQGLAGVTAVRFNGQPATSFTLDAASQITAFVPPGATSGPVSVTTAAGIGVSAGNFTLINSIPFASAGAVTTNQNRPVSGKLAASDGDGDALTFQIIARRHPEHGTVKITNPATGDFTYTPKVGFTGTDLFFFSVSDGKQQSNVAAVHVTVILSATSVCLQDDHSGDILTFDTRTGDFTFIRCGDDGLTLTGRGAISRVGCLLKLEDPRVSAAIDRCLVAPLNVGKALIRVTPLGPHFTIRDRNITDNTCNCPDHHGH